MTVKIWYQRNTIWQYSISARTSANLDQSLSQLKGAAMKAGQLLSIELDDYFPPEAAEILSQF